ncbi:putative pyruvate formate lyase activating enzyme [Thermodesulfitimonas autotrophica]|uniref:Putative pyruvate formate lyase activating enzyme n=1 Tax=Thermodesulfitimonas autotrophica TaxID=1894989 RepID=A0A3N5BML3_9THEO|nr:radical SAM protein [Thermodesulfitimonas autotrophica]RPF46975.1 putative pyruvate formate lyase activating enzyme [Thermodesulfitimonas autotrophica]
MAFTAAYRRLGPEELRRRVAAAYRRLKSCDLCPRRCGVNRLKGERGACRGGREAVVSSYGPHFGEEAPLVGTRGSGTIFFAYCTLHCVFCQNYELSHHGEGEPVSVTRLARMMLALELMGCHNINLVSPTHFVPQILAALAKAAAEGLNLPIVYNTGGYESLETLKLLDGIIDIYMPDFKYTDPESAAKYSGARDYPQVVKEALKEMQRQVGDLTLNEQGVALRGLLVRHLVLPENLAGTKEVVAFLAREVSPRCFINVMAQYYPAYRAREFPPLNRRITPAEYEAAVKLARDAGLRVYRD